MIAFLLLGYSGKTGNGAGNAGTPELLLGLIALIPAVILLAPFFLAVLAGQAATPRSPSAWHFATFPVIVRARARRWQPSASA